MWNVVSFFSDPRGKFHIQSGENGHFFSSKVGFLRFSTFHIPHPMWNVESGEYEGRPYVL